MSCSGMARVLRSPASRPCRRRRGAAPCCAGRGGRAGRVTPAAAAAVLAVAALPAAAASHRVAPSSASAALPNALRTLPSSSVRLCTVPRRRSSERWICVCACASSCCSPAICSSSCRVIASPAMGLSTATTCAHRGTRRTGQRQRRVDRGRAQSGAHADIRPEHVLGSCVRAAATRAPAALTGAGG